MKRILLAMSVSLFSAVGFAQSGNNQIGVAANVAFPTGDASDLYKLGLGGTVKGLYGIGSAGQITFTTGLISFSAKNEIKEALDADKINSSIIPLLAGYRHNFSGFYVEPQVGYAINSSKIKGGLFDGSDSEGAFTWAAGAGYVFNNIEVGARYQSSHKDGTTSSFFGVKIGYLFSLGGK